MTSQEFTVRKRICTAADGYQFITSGFPNRSRCITEYRPRSVERGEDSTIAVIRNGSVYIEQWQDRDHFPDIAEGEVFPVWVRVERINERV